jgi:hypothetical protein
MELKKYEPDPPNSPGLEKETAHWWEGKAGFRDRHPYRSVIFETNYLFSQISTRLFFSLPSAVSFEATGS